MKTRLEKEDTEHNPGSYANKLDIETKQTFLYFVYWLNTADYRQVPYSNLAKKIYVLKLVFQAVFCMCENFTTYLHVNT